MGRVAAVVRSGCRLLLAVSLAAALAGGCGPAARRVAGTAASGASVDGTELPRDSKGGVTAAGADFAGARASAPVADMANAPAVRRGGEITIALMESVDPHHAPSPHNEAERLVFRQLYETLVTVDTNGAAAPGLAESWRAEVGGQLWTFTLRRDAQWWDGRPLRAAEVKAGWAATQRRDLLAGRRLPWVWLDAEAGSIRTIDDHRLSITLPEPQLDFPLLLAHPALAVARPCEGTDWPLGTGSYEPRSPVQPDGAVLVCEAAAGRSPPWSRLVFRASAPGMNADLRVVRDRAEMARWRADSTYTVSPLPWDRLYVLIAPPKHRSSGVLAKNVRLGAVGEAMQAETASLVVPCFLDPCRAPCPQLHGPAGAGGGNGPGNGEAAPALNARHLVYPAQSDLARRLAEFLVARQTALSAEPPDDAGRAAIDSLTPVGLDRNGFERALRAGTAACYLLEVHRVHATPCFELAGLLGRAGWLQSAAFSTTGAPPDETALEIARRLVGDGLVVPLVKTRAALVHRRDLGAIAVTHDGSLDLTRHADSSRPP